MNFNKLIGRYPGADGMKTGFICASGFNLVASATRNGKRLIAVVLGAQSSAQRAVKAAHPDTPLIAISGQFRSGLVGSCTAAAALGVRQVIAKPLTRCDLLAAVHGVIGPAH